MGKKLTNIHIIDKHTAEVEITNSIAELYKEVRQASKSPSFAMQ
jgi:hypothetical protein